MRASASTQSGTDANGSAAGFTLLELLVVLAMLAAIMSAMPLVISAALPGVRMGAFAQELASDLRILRTSAIRSMRQTRLSISQTPPGWTGADGRFRALPAGTRIRVQTDLGQEEEGLFFTPDGMSNGGRIWLDQEKVGRIVSVAWPTGRVHVERP